MVLLNLKEQHEIIEVIEYLIFIHRKSVTVEDVMKRFGLSFDQYRMCCNLGAPALAEANKNGRFTTVSRANKSMRNDIKELYYALSDDDHSKAADGVRALYRSWCNREGNNAESNGYDAEECDDDEEAEDDVQ